MGRVYDAKKRFPDPLEISLSAAFNWCSKNKDPRTSQVRHTWDMFILRGVLCTVEVKFLEDLIAEKGICIKDWAELQW